VFRAEANQVVGSRDGVAEKLVGGEPDPNAQCFRRIRKILLLFLFFFLLGNVIFQGFLVQMMF